MESQAGVVSPQGDESGKQLHDNVENEAQEVPKTGTSETGKEVGGIGKQNTEGVGSQDTPDEKVEGDREEGATEGRRGTLEDAKGVLHHGIASSGSGK